MNKLAILIALCIIVICFVSCASIHDNAGTISEVGNTDNDAIEREEESLELEEKIQEVQFGEYKIFGCHTAILSFVIDSSIGVDYEYIKVIVKDGQSLEEIEVIAELFEDVYYARLEELKEDSYYDVYISTVNKNNVVELETDFSFFTPKRSISLNDLQPKIDQEIKDYKRTDENDVLLQTQACLSLLGFEVGKFGRFNDIAQANLCTFEYSVNKLNDYVYYKNIIAHPNEKSLSILKDILSTKENINKDDILQDFVTSSFPLSEYAILDEEGGKLDIESYIIDQLDSSNEFLDIYTNYPFEIETQQFKDKYSEYFSDGKIDSQYEQKLKQYSAKNKALFSYYAQDILREFAKPHQRTIDFYDGDKSVTVDTMIAYSYMFIDALQKTGLHFEISTAYRDFDFQWLLYSQKSGMSVAQKRNGDWHFTRQKLSFVPGFSNHQYGVSIDFHERNTFGQTKLYKYLLENADRYGFYNYYREPWHWSYLGKLS